MSFCHIFNFGIYIDYIYPIKKIKKYGKQEDYWN